MKPDLPFKTENERNFFNKFHPIIRFLIPFILVLPFLIFNDMYLAITIIFIVVCINVFSKLHLLNVISRLKILIPFLFMVCIFIPFYFGHTILFQINIGIILNVYLEGIQMAFLLLFRIVGAAFTFLTFFSSLTYSEFIDALTRIRIIPSFIVGSIVIMLHYIPILAISNKRVLDAQELRGKNIATYWQRVRTHGFIMGKNLVNNMERSEKLYESLKLRGFTGKLTFAPRKLKLYDYFMLLSTLSFIIFLVYFLNLEQIYMEVINLFLQ
ncbi:MAG: energy-coupling factor transporter transmembrane component T family protein [Candidatus Thorarchaeota archaeon]